MNSFHRTATFLLILFMGVMAVVTGIAFTRKSGNTGMDMGKVHLYRNKMKNQISATSAMPQNLDSSSHSGILRQKVVTK